MLLLPDSSKLYKVETNALDYAIEGVLRQKDVNSQLQLIAFFLKKFNSAQRKYIVYNKELIAIVIAFKEQKLYLSGSKELVQVYIDHQNLQYFIRKQDLSKRQARQRNALAEFHFKTDYRKGVLNGQADALSKRLDHASRFQETALLLLQKQADKLLYYLLQDLNDSEDEAAYYVCIDLDQGRRQTRILYEGVRCRNCCKECGAIFKEE